MEIGFISAGILRLEATGFYYTEMLIMRHMIPVSNKTQVLWNNVENVWLNHGLFAKKIELLLREKKNDRNVTKTIKIICSEYDAEYILQAIKLNMA